jgi:LmbE family N-acetylglucosaminyl deacetylase
VVAAGTNAWRGLRLRAKPLSDCDLRRHGNWLIIAPHPDDETLGAGGLIARLGKIGVPARIAFLTDGSASHIDAPGWEPRRIARVRSAEADRALSALGTDDRKITLGWPDSKPYSQNEKPFDMTVAYLAGLCWRENIRAIATTWRNEGHCDHKAAFQVAAALHRALRGRAALYEYPVWGWADPSFASGLKDYEIFTLADPGSVQRRRRAIRHHKTQISPMIPQGEKSFRLPPRMIALAERDPSILLRGDMRHAA